MKNTKSINTEGLLTTKLYWEKYYKNSSVQRENIVKICSEYNQVWDLFVNSTTSKPKTILEVGAYPGRYLSFLSSKYALFPTAIDFNSDTTRISKAFEQMGVHDYRIIQEDFLTHIPNEKYDLVYSLGFIEHFENFDKVMDKHVQMLNPGGSLLIMVPNKRWFRKWYGYLCDFNNLKAHNLKCMSKDVFRSFAERNNLQIIYLNYWGGFAYRTHQELNFFQKMIYKTVRFISLRLSPIIKKYPNKFLSGTLIGVFKKPL